MDNYDYKGEKFLNRLYKDLDLEDVVMHTALPSDGKEEKVKKYLDRLRKVEELAKNSKHNGIELLKEMYYKKYVIKEENIPESYFELQKKISLDRGLGHVEINEGMRQQLCESVIKDQKKSLDTWIDYFLSEDSFYPEWFEYYAFQGMLKLGSYDKERSTFTKRTDTTTNIFVDLNREALALVYDNLVDALDGKEVDDETLKKLLDGGNFSKLYSYFIKKLDQANKDIDSNEGKWVKYNQGSEPDELVKSLEGKGTGWCTAGYETARTQLEGGDFYVYYTKDSNGEYKQPRIAIRMSGTNKIGEIRGIADHQNMESEMEEVLDKKLEEFPDKEKYKKKVNDMNKLTDLYNRYLDVRQKIDALEEKIGPIKENNNPFDFEEPIYEKSELEYKLSELYGYYNNGLFNADELKFLYEIDTTIDGFGYRKDPRIDEILGERYLKKDLSVVFNCSLNEISTSTKDVLDGKKITYFYGDLDIKNYSNFKNLKFPEYIIGDLFFDYLGSMEGLELPKYVSGDLDLTNLKSAKNLKFPESIGGDLDLDSLESAQGLKFPKSIGGGLYLSSLKSTEGLELPESIGGDLELDSLESAEGLKLPESIGGDLGLDSLESAQGLKFPKSIGGGLYLGSIKGAEGLRLPESMGGWLCLNSLESAEGLKLPESIGGGLDLQSLKSIDGLIVPENFEYERIVSNYITIEDLINKALKDKAQLVKSKQRGYSSIIVLSILTSLVSILIIVLGVFLNK